MTSLFPSSLLYFCTDIVSQNGNSEGYIVKLQTIIYSSVLLPNILPFYCQFYAILLSNILDFYCPHVQYSEVLQSGILQSSCLIFCCPCVQYSALLVSIILPPLYPLFCCLHVQYSAVLLSNCCAVLMSNILLSSYPIICHPTV